MEALPMSRINEVGHLQIEQDLNFQRRMWIAQRVGWVILGLLILAVLLGLAGQGPLGRASVSDAQGMLQIRYDRFWRVGKPTRIQVRFDARPDTESLARLWLNREYLARFALRKVVPEPIRIELDEGRLICVFLVSPSGAGKRQLIEFELEPTSAGMASGRMGVPGGPEVAFDQFVYP